MKIKSVTIEIDGKDITLSLEQVRELRDELSKIFEGHGEPVYIPVPSVPYYPLPYWSIYPPYFEPIRITCGDTVPIGSTTTGISSSSSGSAAMWTIGSKDIKG